MHQFVKFDPDLDKKLLQECLDQNKIACTDLLILNNHNQILIQKRSHFRRVFPNQWEVPGGHIEPGESIAQTLTREIQEELSMQVISLDYWVSSFDWGQNLDHRNIQILGKASGEPIMEGEKVTEFCWVGLDNIAILDQSPDHQRILKFVLEQLQSF
jgi:8-oxo-dGTP diphosphatase